MPLASVAGVVQAEVKFSYAGIFAENVLKIYVGESPIGIPRCEEVAETVGLFYVTWIMPLLNEFCILTEVHAQSLETALPFEAVQTYSQAGGTSGQGAPINVASRVAFLSGLIGRSFKGAAYLPGIPETAVGVRGFDTTWLTNMQLAWEEFPAALAAETLTHVVVSRIQGGVPLTVPDVTPVTLYQVSPIVADMGRRINN